ncbi:PREDICTED: flap endonuclease 1 [Branchiostoma belcheri]|uniref:Flap endonuclease 1 n=1 Tax=Branchiostoma belcheri TaxID=7741 RepID=A0A6P4YHZ5_BRABE|nr:PREDICTED: flap endonuclease 1 [Branchiostoma belcheri]
MLQLALRCCIFLRRSDRFFGVSTTRMGIQGLAKLIGDHAPGAMKENEIKNYFGRKVAIDASMSIYQFLIAVRQDGNMLTNDAGEATSHLMGMFYRTIRMVDNGIKPVYVFDGKPPNMKSGELAKRAERREEAQKALEKAEEAGEAEDVNKFQKRLVKVTREHNEECKKLLTLMGIPYVDAPCEAEAQCAELAKKGKVYAAGTEDMDVLTFGTNIMLRHLTFSEARKMPIKEYYYDRLLAELDLTQDQFIDLCILLGCDYCDSIRGIGPKRAIELIRQHKSIEEILKHIDTKKFPVPEDWPYDQARRLFKEPEVTPADQVELKWTDPDEEGLVQFMSNEKGFSEDRIKNGAKKLRTARHTSTQGRLDSFFKVMSSPSVKRKEPPKGAKGSASKKAKMSGGKFKKPK